MNNIKSTFSYLNLIKKGTTEASTAKTTQGTGAATAMTTQGTEAPTSTTTQGKFRDQFDIDSISILI